MNYTPQYNQNGNFIGIGGDQNIPICPQNSNYQQWAIWVQQQYPAADLPSSQALWLQANPWIDPLTTPAGQRANIMSQLSASDEPIARVIEDIVLCLQKGDATLATLPVASANKIAARQTLRAKL